MVSKSVAAGLIVDVSRRPGSFQKRAVRGCRFCVGLQIRFCGHAIPLVRAKLARDGGLIACRFLPDVPGSNCGSWLASDGVLTVADFWRV